MLGSIMPLAMLTLNEGIHLSDDAGVGECVHLTDARSTNFLAEPDARL